MFHIAALTHPARTTRRSTWALPFLILSLSTAATLAAQEAKSAPKKSDKASTEQAQRDTSREITFMIHRKEDKTFVDFKVKRASRAEIEKALARVEILAKDGMNYGGGRWPLSAELKGDEEVLSFELEHMTLESIRKTL